MIAGRDTGALNPDAHVWTAHVDPRVVGYIEGSLGDAGDRNRQAWRDLAVVPRSFRDVSQVSSDWIHAGRTYAAPVVVAPWASQTLVHPDGERATSLGAERADVPWVLSSASATRVEDLPAPGASFFAQLYVPPVRAEVVPFIRAAEGAGALGLMVTVDAPPAENAFDFRAAIETIAPPWVNFRPGTAGIAGDLGLHDLEWLASVTSLPIWVKGVLSAHDVGPVLGAGAAGIVVSNHGGRQLGDVITTRHALPGIVAAVAGAVPVWVDSGIRTGTDVFRALALGADAVLVGRVSARALAGGADTLASVLVGLRDELVLTMTMAGTPTLGRIDRHSLAL